MRRRKGLGIVALIAVLALVAGACGDDDEVSGEGFTFGLILVGPENDRGYSQAHFEGGQYVEEMLGATMISLDVVNPADRPEVTVDQVAADMIEQGAQLVIATSDDMKDGIELAAANHPDVPMIWASGDSAWEDGKAFRADLPNLGNVFGKMEFGKMIAGCAAGLKTQTGQIGYLGPLVNDETRRLVNSAFLGAQYCANEYRDGMDIEFSVNWIGFWFNIPGVTLDPTLVANDFFDGGADVVLSGIDTTEALVVGGQRAAAGESVWAVPYDYEDACAEAPGICLGTPYFNWGPAYLDIVKSVIQDDFSAEWTWLDPNWDNLTDPDSGAIGWLSGDGLGDASADLDKFIDGLADGSINLFTGPLNYQDGSSYLGDGEEATDFQIWYTEQLLEGITGASS
jgi:simple sugar transport system substrate-binding protein